MQIEKTQYADLEQIMNVYAFATQLMRQSGNYQQWTNGYPAKEIVLQDIENGNSYICKENSTIVGVFCFFVGEEPTYAKIYNGQWLNDLQYGVVHRLAKGENVKNMAQFCLQWTLNQCNNLRIDTHKDNLIMQHILQKMKFTRCGTIYLKDSTPRIAYQKTTF
ncbi:MAG: GNAT family N-acetyltransferase [Bacteroidales bacterium]|jgi:hypothetical protein|nr:GNAT family N-acetyltransferase [Bacteroidales bacterium]